jgi:hypothetical protein
VVSPIKQYLDSTGKLPEDALLGYIAFTLGSDGDHDRDALVEEFKSRGLNHSLIPPTSRAVDAFKKAIANYAKFSYPMTRTTTAHLLFREVAAPNPTEVSLRAIMREERCDAKSSLSYEKVGEVKLYRGPRRKGQVDDSGARFSWGLAGGDVLSGPERARLMELGGLIKSDYERYMTYLEGIRIRALILEFLRKECQSVALKASVHFVPIAQAEKLHLFAEAIGTLEDCKVDLVPLVDLVDARDQVLEALQQDTEATLGTLLEDLNKARAGNTTPKTYAALRQRYDAIMQRSEQYAELLDLSVERTHGATDVARAMLNQISRQFMNINDKDEEAVA